MISKHDIYWENIKYSKSTREDMSQLINDIIVTISPTNVNQPKDMFLYFEHLSQIARKNGIYFVIRFKDHYVESARKNISEYFVLHRKERYAYLIAQPTEDKLYFSVLTAVNFRKFKKEHHTLEIFFDKNAGGLNLNSIFYINGKPANLIESPAFTHAIFNDNLELIKLDEKRVR